MNKFFAALFCLSLAVPTHAAMGVEGASDIVDFGRVTQIDGASAGTVCAWMYRGSIGTIVSFSRDVAVGTRFGNYWYSDDSVYAVVDVGGGGQSYRNYGLGGTGWHHIAIVFDGSLSGNARIAAYLDGVAQTGTVTGSPPATIISDAATFKIGQVNGSASDTGRVDDARVYSRALSAKEIETLALSRTRVALTEGLAGWWKLDGGADGSTCSGATVADSSGNGYTGTCTNSPIWYASDQINYP
jgi:hypothetical protein